jgi:energy-coupling factor transporter transmembrane protein EcfT
MNKYGWEMKLGKPVKIIIGALTLWPILYMMGFVVFFVVMFFTLPHMPKDSGMPAPFVIIFGLHLFTILFSFLLVAFYIYYLFKTDKIPQDKKALWAAVLFLGNIFAMPVFWYLYIWREPEIQYENIEDAFPDAEDTDVPKE